MRLFIQILCGEDVLPKYVNNIMTKVNRAKESLETSLKKNVIFDCGKIIKLNDISKAIKNAKNAAIKAAKGC